MESQPPFVFKTLITAFGHRQKPFLLEKTSRYRFHNLTITTKSLKITTKCAIFKTKHSKITIKSQTINILI
jgi:hypothetical protein